MAIYVIFRASNSSKLEAALKREFGDDAYLSLGGDQFLLSSSDSTPRVADRLGLTDGASGSAIVVRMSSYHGRANPEVWEWMESKLETSRG
jgi:hypothetical protein